MIKYTRRNIYKKHRQSRKNREIIICAKSSPFRLAILLCGRIKGYTNVEQYLLNLKRKYNATIFCSLNKKIKSDYINKFCSRFGINDEQLNLEPTKTHEHIYSNLTLCADEMNIVDRERTYSQYFHKYKCFKLLKSYQLKHSVNFDCVLFFRADIDSSEEFKIRRPEPNTIYIPEGKDYYGLNDQIAYGDFEAMRLYSDGVVFLSKVCLQLGILKFPYSINENLMKRHIENTKCRVERFPYNYELHHLRSEPLSEYDDYE